jgi:hypothetical protein
LVVGHIPVGISGDAAAHAVDLTRLALPFVFQPSCLKESDKFTAVDQHRPSMVNCRQTSLDPGPR